MSQVGVAACPKCGARYGVEDSAAGQTLPCPACGTKFVVQPVARAADDFLPPTVDLASGGPVIPATRVLEPVVYPYREIPWTPIAIGTGLCLVLGLILFGGWQAYKAIDAAVASTATDQEDQSPTVAGDKAIRAASDVADQVAADASAAVQGAGSMIDRLAGAVTDSIDVPKTLPDSHDRLADEYAQLRSDYLRVRDEFSAGNTGDTADKLTDLQLRTEDLAIRWFLLAPMTSEQRDRLQPPLKVQFERGRDGTAIGEPDKTFASDRAASVIAARLENSEKMLLLALSAAMMPPKPLSPLEEKYAEAAAASKEICRQLYSVRSAADLERVSPAVQSESARLRVAAEAAAQMGGGFDLTNLEASYRMASFMAQVGMAQHVSEHVRTRFGLGVVEAAQAASTAEARRAEEEKGSEFGSSIASLLADYSLAATQIMMNATRPKTPDGTPVAVTSVTTGGGPTINVPGFGMPPGFGPPGFGPRGFGPPPGFGPAGGFGPSSGFGGGPAGAAAAENVQADFEAKRQTFVDRNGAEQTLTVRASGGTEGQFTALQATVMRLVRPRSHSMFRTGPQFQLLVAYDGDVEVIAGAITSGKVTSTDVTGRLIVVDFK